MQFTKNKEEKEKYIPVICCKCGAKSRDSYMSERVCRACNYKNNKTNISA